MMQKLKELMVRIETWPEEAQEELMRSAVNIEMRHRARFELTDDDRAALERSLDDVRNDRFATDEEVAQVFDRFRHV